MNRERVSRASLPASCALAVALLAGGAQAGVNFSFGSASIQVGSPVGDGQIQWNEVGDGATAFVGHELLTDGIKMFGNRPEGDTTTDTAISLSGERFDQLLQSYGTGANAFRLHLEGSYQFYTPAPTRGVPTAGGFGDDAFFQVHFNYGWSFDGGMLRPFGEDAGFSVRNNEDGGVYFIPGGFEVVGIGVGSGPQGEFDEPGAFGTSFNFNFDNDFRLANFVGLDHGNFEVNIAFQWFGFEPGSTFTLTIPHDSVDINVVPTPGAAGLALAGGVLVAKRRRR